MNPSVPRAWPWGSSADHLQRSSDWIIRAMTTNQAKLMFTKNTDHHTEGCDKSANDLSQVQSGVSGFSFLSFCVECYPMLSKHIQAYENQLVTGPWGRCMRLGIQKCCITLRLYWREMSWVMRIWLGLLCHLSNDLVLLPVVFSIGFQLLNDSKAAFEIKFLSSIGL